MFYIYILYSESADKFYVGHTDNPSRRILEHNNNPKMTFTHKFRPWKMVVLFEAGNNRNVAMSIEKFIKNQKSRKFIQNLITQDTFTGKLAQLVRVPKIRD